ncbi:MAG: heme-binding domain-containing protein [Bacteroidales bacterium]|nr:heme-binding domain-containing protein [Bacteroidales bacterium]
MDYWLLVIIQFFQVDRTNPTIKGEFEAPKQVKSIFERSCYDCHSNETHWPFYSYIAPVSWLVVKDVNEGREELNFSEWDKYNQEKKAEKAEEIIEEIEEDEMPMKIYLITHPDAKLSKEEKETIREWTKLIAESTHNN